MMDIDASYYEKIRNLNVHEHKVSCDYSTWKERFQKHPDMTDMLSVVEANLGGSFGRAEIVSLYKKSDVVIDAKFLSAMIWGYEAPAGSRRDNRGPARVEEMLKSHERSKVLSEVRIGTEKEVLQSYRSLNKTINKCGPSFLTKHLYFLGKSSGAATYPLIMDDRVAVGLVKLALKDSRCLDFVSVHAQRKASVYGEYLKFASKQASNIGCDLDKVEYFLFLNGG